MAHPKKLFLKKETKVHIPTPKYTRRVLRSRHEILLCLKCFLYSILLRLHRSFKVSIGLDEASCREAGGSHPGCTSALSAQRGSNPGNKVTAQKLINTQDA